VSSGLYVIVGDCTLDVTVAAPASPARGGDAPAAISLGPGGQAANVAVRLARRGGDARLVAPVGDDAAGRLLREALAADGVELSALPTPDSAVVVIWLDPDGERTMASSRVSLDPHAAVAALRRAAGDGATWGHCSGYALLDDASGDELAVALGELPATIRRSVGGGSIPNDPDRVARFRRRLAVVRPGLVIVNGDEAAALLSTHAPTAQDEPAEAARGLGDLAEVVIVTAGSAGSAASVHGEVIVEPAPELDDPPRDATGSGDAYAAALIASLADSAWPPEPGVLRAAMGAAGELGARVARVTGAQARVDGEATR
jgi:sugar/nucleoside kinase (ribokinase family)